MSSDATRYIDAQTERLVLGTLLRGSAQVPELTVDDFGVEAHRQIWQSISRVAPEVKVGADSVAEDLTIHHKLESIGGMAALMDLHAAGAPGMPLAGYVRILREKSAIRRISQRALQIDKQIATYGLNGNADTVIEAAREIAELAQRPTPDNCSDIDDLPGVGDTEEMITYVRDPELPAGSIVALTGDMECGKSTLVTAWCRDAIAEGHPVLYLDRENPRHVVQDRMNRLGLKDCPELRWWGRWCTREVPDPSSETVAAWVKSHTVTPRPAPLVVVDSLSAFHGGDENDAMLMRQFIDPLRKLAAMGAVPVIIHHVGVDATKPYRGSSDFGPGIDQGFLVKNVSSSRLLDRLVLKPFKSRYGLCEDIVYRYAGGRFIRDDRQDAPARTVADQLTEILRMNPGTSSREFDSLAAKRGVGRTQTRDFIANGVLSGVIRRESGSRNQVRHYLSEGE